MLSLNPGEDRLCMVWYARHTKDGSITAYQFYQP